MIHLRNFGNNNDPVMGAGQSTWDANSDLRKKIMFENMSKLPYDFNNKKILTIAGGVGRNADTLRNLGAKVTNSDLGEFCVNIGKKYYPKINHIVYDMSNDPLEGFDYVVWEQIWIRAYNFKLWEHMYKWKNFARIIPNPIRLKIFKFNSDYIDKTYYQPEKIGNDYIKKQFGDGICDVKMETDKIEDLIEEDIEIDLFNLNINIPKVSSHRYQILGFKPGFISNRIEGIFISNGIRLNFENGKIKKI